MGDATPSRESLREDARLADSAAAATSPSLDSLLRLASDSLPVGILIRDECAGAVLYRNRAFLDVWGIEDPEEQDGFDRLDGAAAAAECTKRISRDARSQESWQRLCRAHAAGESADEEIALRDGRYLRVCSLPLRDDSGVPSRRLCIFEGITTRKQSESLLLIQRDLAQALSATGDLAEMLEAALDAVLQVDGMDCAGIYLVDDHTVRLDLAAHRGFSPGFVNAVSAYPPEAPQSRLALAGRPVYGSYTDTIAGIGAAAKAGEGLRALAVVPVVYEGWVIACLNAASHTSGKIPAVARRALEAIAGQLGGAVARVRAEDARHRSELDLRESEERMRLGLEGSDVGIWDWDLPTGSLVFVRHWAEILGYPPEEIEDHIRMWESHVHPDDKPWVTQALEDHFAGRTPFYETEHRIRARSGEWRWMLDRGRVVLRDADGRPIRAVGLHLDITGRKQVEEELRGKEDAERRFRERLMALHEIGMDLLYAGSVDDLCRRAVELGRERLGFERLGIWFRDNDPDYALGSFGISEEGVLRDERGRCINVIPESPLARVFAGKEQIVLCREAALRDDRGEVVGQGPRVLAAIWDGREVLGAIAADSFFSGSAFSDEDAQILALYAATVGHLHSRQRMEAMRRHAEELVELDRQKDEFLAMLSHELRNPVGAVSSALHLIGLDDVAAESSGRAREVMRRQVQHLGRLLDDLLDLSRLTTAQIQLQRERLNLATAIENAIDSVRFHFVERRHSLEVLLPPEPIFVDADPTRLEQVIWNLLVNAARYTPPGGHIRVRASQEMGQAVVRVADNGLGIPADLLPRVFDLYMQIQGSGGEAQRKGLGIGLALVRRLVEMHGGRVEARSGGEGRGSEFAVYLPSLPPGADEVQAARVEEPTMDGTPKRVMVVDDNRDGAEVLGDLIQAWGHESVVAYDGVGALEAARAWRPEIVLMDLDLPQMDGCQVAARMRQMPELCGVLLVAVTGHGREQDRQRATDAGFDHFLTKPADPLTLHRLLAGAEP